MNKFSAPVSKKKKELKTYTFTRVINLEEKNEETTGNNDLKSDGKTLNLTLTLYDNEISLIAQRENIEHMLPKIVYEKYLSLETLQSLNKFFSVLDAEKIFDIIKSGFEQKLDHISIEENKVMIKLVINFMEVITEEIIFELDKMKLSDEEETTIIKESIKLLTEEKKNLKNEVLLLTNTIEELKKITSEKDNQIIKQLEENKNEFERKLKEKEDENKKKENEFQNMFKKLQKEMSEVKEIEKYFREKIIIEEKEQQEIKSHSIQRKKTINSNIFNFDIKILIFNEKIKFKIKEIQDNLQNNPTLYETDFEMNYFGGLYDCFKNQGGIKSIFDFLILRFNDNEDKINKELNKIIIKVKYTLGSKEDEITFNINKKELGLKNVLTNVDETLRVLNKEIINTNNKLNKDMNEKKEEFIKNLLEKVYPIGSYYWSEKNISPENLFGGRWTKIEGRFLFASDSNHYVGQTGGEERHYLTIDEIPSHNHGYQKFEYKDYWWIEGNKNSDGRYPFLEKSGINNLIPSNTNNIGGSQSHNNMPPYLTANCWKRIG